MGWDVNANQLIFSWDKTDEYAFPKQELYILTTGHSDWKITKVNRCSSETVHIWPYVGNAKMRLRGGSLFEKL